MNVYEIKSMGERICSNPYVGRGIVIGKTENGKTVFYRRFDIFAGSAVGVVAEIGVSVQVDFH